MDLITAVAERKDTLILLTSFYSNAIPLYPKIHYYILYISITIFCFFNWYFSTCTYIYIRPILVTAKSQEQLEGIS